MAATEARCRFPGVFALALARLTEPCAESRVAGALTGAEFTDLAVQFRKQ